MTVFLHFQNLFYDTIYQYHLLSGFIYSLFGKNRGFYSEIFRFVRTHVILYITQ